MKDCQTVKYGCLDCWGSREREEDWLIDLLRKRGRAVIGLLGKEHREFARRMHEVQVTGMVSVQNVGEWAWQSCWHWEH